ncbi:MAG: hypothetical protein HYS57_02675 [Parcubacteria group bacterium]|nr:hypothetical protein [Parcubacteria group bacterium]
MEVVVGIAEFVRKVSPVVEYLLVTGLLVLQGATQIPKFTRMTRIPFVHAVKFAVLVLMVVIVVQAVLMILGQYLVWKAGPPGIYFLPPHQPLGYFLGYAWQHFGKMPFATLVVAGLSLLLLWGANRFSGERFFYREEPFLAALGVMTAGWPLGFFVLVAVLAVGAFVQSVQFFLAFRMKVSPGRFPLVYIWLPVALITMIWGEKIASLVGLTQLYI